MVSRNYLVAAAVLAVAILVSIPLFTGYVSILMVSGDSMHPDMPDGTVALCHATDGWDVEEGDVVAFRLNDDRIVHQVIDVETEHNMLDEPTDRRITAQGTNNDVPDPAVPPHLVECSVSVYVTPGLDFERA